MSYAIQISRLLLTCVLSWLIILIVRIEFSPLVLIDVSNGHFYTLETTTMTSLEEHLISHFISSGIHISILQSNPD